MNANIHINVDEVALLAEGVDRNYLLIVTMKLKCLSPSSRRAWIEISRPCCTRTVRHVALLAEGVDRNNQLEYL